jgi:hypothetical protein
MVNASPKSMSVRGSLLARPDPEMFRYQRVEHIGGPGRRVFPNRLSATIPASTRVQPAIWNATPLRCVVINLSLFTYHLSRLPSPLSAFLELLIFYLLFAIGEAPVAHVLPVPEIADCQSHPSFQWELPGDV